MKISKDKASGELRLMLYSLFDESDDQEIMSFEEELENCNRNLLINHIEEQVNVNLLKNGVCDEEKKIIVEFPVSNNPLD